MKMENDKQLFFLGSLTDNDVKEFMNQTFQNVLSLVLEYCKLIDCPNMCGKRCYWYWGCGLDCGMELGGN